VAQTKELFTWLLEVIQTGMPCLKSDKSCEQDITLAKSGGVVACCGEDVPAGYRQRLPLLSHLYAWVLSFGSREHLIK
jgi:hypothetical protein